MILFRVDGLPIAFSADADTTDAEGVRILPALRDVPGLLAQMRFSLDPRGGVVSGGSIRVQVADVGSRLAALVAPAASPDARITDWQIAPTVTAQAYVRVSPTSAFSVGDIVYAPLDAWEVEQVEPTGYPAGTIRVRRGVYSALPDTSWRYQPAYQRGIGAADLGWLAIGRALGLQGRLCTLWMDSRLVWIGFVDEVEQHGVEWTISARWLLDGWRERFSAEALPGFQVNTVPNLGGYRWHQGTVVAPDGSGGWLPIGGTQTPTVSDYTGRIALDAYYGVLCRDTTAEWIPSPQNRATRAAMGDDGWHQSPYADTLCTSPRKLPPCGWIDGAGMAVNILGDLPATLAGSWLWVPDGIAGRCAKKIKTVGSSWIVLDEFSYDEDGNPLDGDPGYTGSEIWFQGAAIVEFDSLPKLIFSLLVSTGTWNNGPHDTLPGYLGFGLPAELVDTTIYPTLYETRILGDLDQVELDAELQALGFFVTFANGRFTVKPAEVPEAYNTTETYPEGDVVKAEEISARWAKIAPIRTITFKAGEDFSLIASTGAYSPATPNGGKAEVVTHLLRDVPAPGHIANILRIHRWASSGSAALRVVVPPGEAPAVGDVVQLESSILAASGAYGATVAGFVAETTITGEFVLHIGPADPGRYLAPALVPVSYASGVLEVTGGALQFFEFPHDTSYVLVRLADGAYENVGACSVIDDTHVQIAIAPGTLDDRIFTIRNYSSIDSSALQSACTFCETTRWRKA